jgi:[ribosomal protein S5]-alanine N-acetyltransferase
MTPEHHGYPLTIPGERVALRDFTPDDLDETMEIVGDTRVTDFLSFDAKTLSEQTRLLNEQIERAQKTPRTEFYLAVESPRRRSVIGFARLGIGAHRSAKLGYAIRCDAWGNGFATEAARLLLGFGFDSLGLHRITAACGPENAASCRVLVKLGFTLEGRLRDHVFTNAAWRDSLLYSLLSTEHRPHP